MNTGLFISQYVKNARRNDVDYHYAGFVHRFVERAEPSVLPFVRGERVYLPEQRTTVKVLAAENATLTVRGLRWYERAWDWLVAKVAR